MKLYKNEEVFNDKVLVLMADAELDLHLDEFNIKEKSLMLSAHKTKWTQTWLREEKLLTTMRDKKDQLQRTYNEKYGSLGARKMETEDGTKLKNLLAKYTKGITEQEETIRYLKCLTEIFREHGFTIKNAIDIIKLEAM